MSNRELAEKIIRKAKPTRINDKMGWYFDLQRVIGMHYDGQKKKEITLNQENGEPYTTYELVKTTRVQAAELAVQQLEKDLDEGVVILSDEWSKD